MEECGEERLMSRVLQVPERCFRALGQVNHGYPLAVPRQGDGEVLKRGEAVRGCADRCAWAYPEGVRDAVDWKGVGGRRLITVRR